MAHSVVITGE